MLVTFVVTPAPSAQTETVAIVQSAFYNEGKAVAVPFEELVERMKALDLRPKDVRAHRTPNHLGGGYAS